MHIFEDNYREITQTLAVKGPILEAAYGLHTNTPISLFDPLIPRALHQATQLGKNCKECAELRVKADLRDDFLPPEVLKLNSTCYW